MGESAATRAASMRSEERVARQDADYEALTRSYERSRNAESDAVARATALAADLAAARTALESEQSRAQKLERALAESTASTEAARSRSDEVLSRNEAALRESERHQTESVTLRDSLAARDAIIVQARRALAERHAQLAALQQEHAKIVPALEGRSKLATQLEGDLRAARERGTALAADLAAARTELESEQSRARKLDKALAESMAATEAARSHGEQALSRSEEALRESKRYQTESHTLRDSLAAREATVVQVRRSLGERDAQLAVLQREHAKIVPALEARTKTGAQLENDLQAARARADAIASELKASQDAAAVLNARLKRSESRLNTARNELGAQKTQSRSYLELLRTREWRRGYDQNVIRDLDARVDAADVGRGAPGADARRVVESQAAAQPAESALGRAWRLGEAWMRGGTWDVGGAWKRVAAWKRVRAERPGAIGLAIGVGAAVFVVAVVAWFFTHRAPVPTQVPTDSSATAQNPGTIIRDCPTCPAMTVLPAGRFKQGSAHAESASFEKPLHWVAIGRPLAMSTTAVTVDEFAEFIAATGRDMQGCDTYDGEWKPGPKNSWKDPGFIQTGTHPATCASWNDAKAYAQWLSAKTGHRYRLPSASEWEYAARAGGEAIQPWNPNGSGACSNANVADESAARRYPGWQVFACDDGYAYTAPVGSFKSNSFGLNDMLGNVFQWTEDCWHADYIGAPIDGSARTDGSCSEHELRGGSWFSTPAYVRANYRNHFAADYRTSTAGIRLVRDMEQ